MMLGISRLGYSCWRLVTGYLCEVLQYSICLTARVNQSRISWARTQVSHVHCLLAETDRIHSNSYTNTHRPTRRPPLDKQCILAIIISTTVICCLKDPNKWPVGQSVQHFFMTFSGPLSNFKTFHVLRLEKSKFRTFQDFSGPVGTLRLKPGHRGVPMPPAGRPLTSPRRSAAWLVVSGGWHGSDFDVVARGLLFFFTKSISAICRRQFADVLACFDVANFRRPMCTSAEL